MAGASITNLAGRAIETAAVAYDVRPNFLTVFWAFALTVGFYLKLNGGARPMPDKQVAINFTVLAEVDDDVRQGIEMYLAVSDDPDTEFDEDQFYAGLLPVALGVVYDPRLVQSHEYAQISEVLSQRLGNWRNASDTDRDQLFMITQALFIGLR